MSSCLRAVFACMLLKDTFYLKWTLPTLLSFVPVGNLQLSQGYGVQMYLLVTLTLIYSFFLKAILQDTCFLYCHKRDNIIMEQKTQEGLFK